jgi:hypothetical protein
VKGKHIHPSATFFHCHAKLLLFFHFSQQTATILIPLLPCLGRSNSSQLFAQSQCLWEWDGMEKTAISNSWQMTPESRDVCLYFFEKYFP